MSKQPHPIWYVDHRVKRSGDGRSPATAFKTIAEAVRAARCGETVALARGQVFRG